MRLWANLCGWLFWQALTDYRAELRDDPIISTHLAKLYDNLLEQNLIRVIEPFSRVQVRTLLGTLALIWWEWVSGQASSLQPTPIRRCRWARGHQEFGILDREQESGRGMLEGRGS